MEKALQRLRRAPERAKDRQSVIQTELPLLEARTRTLVDESERGHATDTLRAELQNAEQRKRALVGRARGPDRASADRRQSRRRAATR